MDIFSNALTAWESWHLCCFAARKRHLLRFMKAVHGQETALSQVVSFHIDAASTLLGAIHRLNGVTGETNELYTAGRGVTLMIAENGDTQSQIATLAFITSALAAGNSVIIASDDRALFAALDPALVHAAFPCNLVQRVPYDQYLRYIESDLGCVAYVGNREMERRLNRQLADRAGAIVALISETDLKAMPLAHDPCLSLRFVTERTRTINVTAVGGNATLLALSGASRPFSSG